MTLSIRDQIIVSVGALLMLALMLTLGGYMAGQQSRQSAQTLATDGVVVGGSITNKVQRFGGALNGPKYTWWLDVTYTTTDGKNLTKTIGVDESAYERTSIGPIPVTYIKSDPGTFFIAGLYDSVNHSDADIGVVDGLAFYGGMVSAVLGFVLAALLITRGGGTAPAAQQQAKPPPGQPYRDITHRQPGQFGRRA
jgi:hypothetical protein